MAAQGFMLLSAAILLLLGSIHLLYTFRGNKLWPRDVALIASMRECSPVLSRETTIWRCWIGFNASHSMGAMLFGLVYGFLAAAHAPLLFQSPFLILVGLAMLGGFFVLGQRYWFSIPFTGISIALVCYLISIGLSFR